MKKSIFIDIKTYWWTSVSGFIELIPTIRLTLLASSTMISN